MADRRHYCPRCGSEASILLNLVNCITPECRNYDSKWAQEWGTKNKPLYNHNLIVGSDHKFLGRFQYTHTSVAGRVHDFDLHSFKNPIGQYMCLARFGNTDTECYYVDERETEIGILSSGPTAVCPAHVLAALKEALRRFRKK